MSQGLLLQIGLGEHGHRPEQRGAELEVPAALCVSIRIDRGRGTGGAPVARRRHRPLPAIEPPEAGLREMAELLAPLLHAGQNREREQIESPWVELFPPRAEA